MGSLGGIALDVGDVLAKKYRLEKLVGEGGTGVVVSAKHLQLEQRVAIKFLRTALASDEVQIRFEREARAIAKLQSEHVVLVLDVGTLDDGLPYMVMEFLEGRDLARTLKESGPLSIEDAVDCMLQVCDALSDAHANGIVHRDLKPANLFLTRRDDGGPHVKVVDFGISKILDKRLLSGARGPKEMTGAFEVLGSPRYMAPEQLRNSKDVDFRADLWSVGAVLFQSVTGKHAFDAESNTQASLRVMTAEPERLRAYCPQAPPKLEEVVNKCLQKDVTKRFQSARELATALEHFASERTKESLARAAKAKEAPSLNIALEVKSVIPPSGEKAPPPKKPPPPVPAKKSSEAVSPIKAFGSLSSSARMAAAKETPPIPPAADTPRAATLSSLTVTTPAVAMQVVPPSAVPTPMRPPPPSVPSPSSPTFKLARSPSSLDGSSVASDYPPPPSRKMKLALAAGGLVLVLAAFGVITLVRNLVGASGESPSLAAQTATFDPPSTAVTVPPPPSAVPLDAGRIPP
jgi:serine/threonine-protein kinase